MQLLTLSRISRKIKTYVQELKVHIVPLTFKIQERVSNKRNRKNPLNSSKSKKKRNFVPMRKNPKNLKLLNEKREDVRTNPTNYGQILSDKKSKMPKGYNQCDASKKGNLSIVLMPLNSCKIELKEIQNRQVLGDIQNLKVLISPLPLHKLEYNKSGSLEKKNCAHTKNKLTVCLPQLESHKTNTKRLLSNTGLQQKYLENLQSNTTHKTFAENSKNKAMSKVEEENKNYDEISECIMPNVMNYKVLCEAGQTNDNKIPCTPLFKRLRQKERKNYLEISQDFTTNETCDHEDPKDQVFHTPKEKQKCIEMTNGKMVDNPNGKMFCKPRVPIYKTIITAKEVEKKDPYELDVSDSKKPPKVKRKQIRKKQNKNALETKSKSHTRKLLNKCRTKNYEETVKQIVKMIVLKKNIPVADKKGTKMPLTTNNTVRKKGNLNQIIDITKEISESCEGNINVSKNETVLHLRDNIKIVNNEHTRKDISDQIMDQNKESNESPVDNTNNQEEPALPSFNEMNVIVSRENDCSSPDIFQDDELCEPNLSDDKYFGFDEEEIQPPLKVNVISNVLINKLPAIPLKSQKSVTTSEDNTRTWRSPALVSHNYFLTYKQNAMPCLKQNPVVDYQLVEKIEEKGLKNKAISDVKLQSSKPPVQTSLLDYIDHSKQIDSDQENINECHLSLFDCEDFDIRPKKNNKNRVVLGLLQEQDQIESTPIKYNQKDMSQKIQVDFSPIKKGRAKILQTQVQSTPIQSNQTRDNISLDISAIASTSCGNLINVPTTSEETIVNIEDSEALDQTYFGFKTTSESANADHTTVLSNRPSEAKPFRINHQIVRTFQKQKKAAEFEKLNEDLPSASENNAIEPVSNNSDIQLFEYPEPKWLVTFDNPIITYGAKRRQRKRLPSVDSDSEVEYPQKKKGEKAKKRKKNEMTPAEPIAYDAKKRPRKRLPSIENDSEEEYSPRKKKDEKSRKRKKDQMTPAEEKEFDKWAASFNAMCEEIDKHELDVE